MHVLKKHPPTQRRAGFTMVELLVVIAIMALVISMMVVAIGRSTENARVNATKATLRQLNDIIQQRVDAIERADVSVEAKKLAQLNSTNNITVPRATFILKKMMYRQALPQRPEDLGGWNLEIGTGDDDAPLAGLWAGATKSEDCKDAASSALLYLALTQGSGVQVLPGGKTYPLPVLTVDGINPRHVAEQAVSEISSVKLSAFVDAWERPLFFYNFPTSFILDVTDATNGPIVKTLIPTLPQNVNVDPLDPLGTNATPFTSATSLTIAPLNPADFKSFNIDYYHQPGTYYVPLVVSGGPDEALGLGLPTDNSFAVNRLGKIVNVDQASDNITSQQP
ncbi:type II secretion system protein [Planctomicrobium sp. SH664]|uniref:type II secretion system protein n=1 Tax=Planctomicrobium sp. SH664 TaxID=3448125 RepID=UPI003F5CAF3F